MENEVKRHKKTKTKTKQSLSQKEKTLISLK